MVDYDDVVAINSEIESDYLNRFPGYRDMYEETMGALFREGRSEEDAKNEFISLFFSGYARLAYTYLNDKMYDVMHMADNRPNMEDVEVGPDTIHFSAARLLVHYLNNPARYQHFIHRFDQDAIQTARALVDGGTSYEVERRDFQDKWASADKYKPSWRDILKGF